MPWDRISQVLSFGSQWGKDVVRLVEGNDALAMLARVEGILEDSKRVLESHEGLLSKGEFNAFSIKHRNLVLKVVEVKHVVQGQETRGLFSTGSSDRPPFRIDQEAVHLFKQARIYQRDLLTASRRAQIAEEREKFMPEDPIPQAEASQTQQSTDSTTTWYSVISPKPPRDSTSESESSSDVTTLVEREPYLAVAHIRPEKSDSTNSEESTDRESYRQILILEDKDKTVVMFNPNRCYPNEESEPLNESTLLEMSRAGEALLRATNPENLQGYEVVKAPQHETSWVDSFVNTLSRLGVGIGADMM